MNPTPAHHHLVIAGAYDSDPAWAAAMQSVPLPYLGALLKQLRPTAVERTPEDNPHTPHRWAMARALGVPLDDGKIPWAAWQLKETALACAEVTPCYWEVRSAHTVMHDPGLLMLTPEHAQRLCADMQPYFATDGITLEFASPTAWYARGAVFADVVTADVDRVVGHDLDPWLPSSAQAALLRRLQNEMQMLLYQHPINDAREALGLPPVNSLWFSGTGRLTSVTPPPCTPQLITTLQTIAWQYDWAAYARAWQTLDEQHGQALLTQQRQGQAVAITLCGAHGAQTWGPAPAGWASKIWQTLTRPTWPALFRSL